MWVIAWVFAGFHFFQININIYIVGHEGVDSEGLLGSKVVKKL